MEQYAQNQFFTLDVEQTDFYTFNWTNDDVIYGVYYRKSTSTDNWYSWTSINNDACIRLEAGRYWFDVIGSDEGETTITVKPVDTPLINTDGTPLVVSNMESYSYRYYVLEPQVKTVYYYSWDVSNSINLYWYKEKDGSGNWVNWNSGTLLALEPGRYCVYVYSYNEIDETGYQLSVLPVTQTLDIGKANTVDVPGNGMVYYKLTAPADSTLSIQLEKIETTGNNMPSVYRLENDYWQSVGTSNLMVIPEGDCYIRLSAGYNSSGSYALTLSEPSFTLAPNTPVTITAPGSNNYAFDRLHIDEEDAGTYAVNWRKTETSGSGNPSIYRSENGNNWTSFDSGNLVSLQAGDYFLRINGGTGDYILELQKQTQTMTVGQAQTFAGMENGVYAYARMTVEEKVPYYYAWMKTENSGSNLPSVSYRKENSSSYFSNWSNGNLLVLEPGEYTIRTNGGYNTAGDYLLTVCTVDRILNLDQPEELSGLNQNDSYIWYKLSIVEDTACGLFIEKTGESGSYAPSVYTYPITAQGTVGSYTSWSANSFKALQAGDYYIRISGSNNTYESCRITVGTIKQTITPDEPLSFEDLTNSDYRFYKFTGTEDALYTYTVEKTSSGYYNPTVQYCPEENLGNNNWTTWYQGDYLNPGKDSTVYIRVYGAYNKVSFNLTLNKTEGRSVSLSEQNSLTGLNGSVIGKMTVDPDTEGVYLYNWIIPENAYAPSSLYYWSVDKKGINQWDYWNRDEALSMDEGVYYFRFDLGGEDEFKLSFTEVTASASGAYTINANSYNGTGYWTVTFDQGGFYTYSLAEPLAEEDEISLNVALTRKDGYSCSLYTADSNYVPAGQYVLSVAWYGGSEEAAKAYTVTLSDACQAITAGTAVTEDPADGSAYYRMSVTEEGIYRLDNPLDTWIQIVVGDQEESWYNENTRILGVGSYLLRVDNSGQGVDFTVTKLSEPITPDGTAAAYPEGGENEERWFTLQVPAAGWYTLSFGQAWPDSSVRVESAEDSWDYFYLSSDTCVRYFEPGLYSLQWTDAQANSVSFRPLESRTDLNVATEITFPAACDQVSILVNVPEDGYYRITWDGERPYDYSADYTTA